MPANEPEILSYIDEIIEATNKDTIEWKRANPTTYIWSVIEPGGSVHPTAKVIVQRVRKTSFIDELGRPKVTAVEHYIFQALDASAVTKLSITGDDSRQINAKLGILYNAIADSMARKGLDFLKTILPK